MKPTKHIQIIYISYTFNIHFIYFSYTFHILFIYFSYTFHILFIYFSYTFIQDGYIQDVFDSPVYRRLRGEIPPGGYPIYIQICWDGALLFKYNNGGSMVPLCYSIMNLPPCLRNKLHVGMHVASFCQGSTASLDVCAQELLDLWNNPIVIGCRTYYVVVAQILMDGPGRSKYCKCEGTNSFAGCNICDVTGMYMLVG